MTLTIRLRRDPRLLNLVDLITPPLLLGEMDGRLPRPKPHRRPLHVVRGGSPAHQLVLPSTGSLEGVPVDLPVRGPLFGGLHGGFGGLVDADLTGMEGVCVITKGS